MSTTSSGFCLYLKYQRCPGFGLTVQVSCRLPVLATKIDAGTRSESATVVASASASGEVRIGVMGRQICLFDLSTRVQKQKFNHSNSRVCFSG